MGCSPPPNIPCVAPITFDAVPKAGMTLDAIAPNPIAPGAPIVVGPIKPGANEAPAAPALTASPVPRRPAIAGAPTPVASNPAPPSIFSQSLRLRPISFSPSRRIGHRHQVDQPAGT